MVTAEAVQTVSVQTARERLAVALDFPSEAEAMALVDKLEGSCKWLKVGMELYYASGNGLVERLKARGFDIFLDLKLHDIPNTVAGAVRSVAGLGAGLLTIHAGGGKAMMTAAVGAAPKDLKLLAVTVLTSMDSNELRGVGVNESPAAQVLRLGRLAVESGIRGLVCSAEEVSALRKELSSEVMLVTPGIRSAEDAVGDQKRVATPESAIAMGSSMLVVGRPITQANDPAAAARRILAEIQRAVPCPSSK
jgi:orotidine-5'-phosphate decarboxylase